MPSAPKEPLLQRFFTRLTQWNNALDTRFDSVLTLILNLLRYLFITMMIFYVGVAIVSLAFKIFTLTWAQGVLDFASIKELLTDGLFTLIVIAIVKTFFIRNSFEYALTLLEIGFVVLIRKLILLETIPEETGLMLVLGITSAIFFGLIIYIYHLKRQWKRDDLATH
ncbi:MAG: hypothetical protein KU37_06820 [Sulfuricurvum sp. PC08-66]|nr:MAG: hypothetical protein KU37_06820 [Sulfuricurvum sp. PC08-66]